MTSESSRWADREAYSLPLFALLEPTQEFFVPYAADSEAFWSQLAAGDADVRRVYSVTHRHGDQKIEATVGGPRKVFNQKKDRRGYVIPSLDFDGRGRIDGATVVAIVDRGDVIEVWSAAMTSRWANPSTVSPADVLSLEYFKPQQA